MASPDESTRPEAGALPDDARVRRPLPGLRRRRRWRAVAGGILEAPMRGVAKYWRGLAVIVAVPSFIIAVLGYFEVHPVWPWDQRADPSIELSIRVAEHAGPSIARPGASLPEPSAFRREVDVPGNADVIFAVLVSFEPELTGEEAPFVLKVDLPKVESTEHVVRVTAEGPEAPDAEAASAIVRVEGEPACLVYLRNTAQFMAAIEGSLLETLDDGTTSVLVDGFEDIVGLMSDWGVSKGVLLFQARTLESPQRSADLVGHGGSPCLPASFGQVMRLP